MLCVLYLVSCTSCDFNVFTSARRAVLITDGGDELFIPEPLREDGIEPTTGRSWRQVIDSGHVRAEEVAICLSCGEASFFPSLADPDSRKCPSCGATSFFDLRGRSLIQWIRRAPKRPNTCPKCGNGMLKAKLWAIT